MKKHVLTIFLFFLPLVIHAQYDCSEWIEAMENDKGTKIFIKVCEYDKGKEGYIMFKNEHDKRIKLNYEILFNDGTTKKSFTYIYPHKTSTEITCDKCTQKNSGIKSWSITYTYTK